MRPWPAALLVIAALSLVGPRPAASTLVDAVLGEVDGHVVTASDIALARALGLFGFQPSTAPITASDLERLVAARIVVREARQIGVGGSPAEIDEAWRAAAERAGHAWLDATGVEPEWARATVAADVQWHRFIDARFRAFVFVSEPEVRAALGPGDHGPDERARMRAMLGEREVQRRLSAWIAESEERLRVRRLLAPGDSVPCPMPMPARSEIQLDERAAPAAHSSPLRNDLPAIANRPARSRRTTP